MTASEHRSTRVANVLLGSGGFRRRLQRRRLQRRHGLWGLGREFDYYLPESSSFERGTRLGGPAYIAASTVGAYTYIEVGCRISLTDVGRFCSIAPYTLIGMAEHPTTGFVATHPAFYRHVPSWGYDLVDADHHTELARTTVGNDVWIGAQTCVRTGVTIGDGAVIGAGSVVTKDVPPYAIAVGSPARTIRYRFDADTIEMLLEARWWDRDLAWLRAHVAEMRDVDMFRRLVAAEHAGAV